MINHDDRKRMDELEKRIERLERLIKPRDCVAVGYLNPENDYLKLEGTAHIGGRIIGSMSQGTMIVDDPFDGE